MHDGTVQAVETIAVGDQLLGLDGSPRTVLAVDSGIDDLYEVKQLTAQSYVATGNHILVLDQSSASLEEGRYKEHSDGLVKVAEYENRSERFKCHFFGYKRGAIFPYNRHQLLDPYFLGVWLGDGDSYRPAITTADPEIVDYIGEIAREHECRVSQFGKPHNKASGYLIARCNGSGQENPVTAKLRALGVIQNKHVPQCYIYASEQQRLALLAGFIDTDGALGTGYYEVSQSNERLLRSIKFIADSLAFKTNIRRIEARCGEVICEAWRLSIGGDIWRIPCLIARKRVAPGDLSKNKDWRRTRIDVVPLGPGEYFGFALDGDRRFFLEDFTVTHNSHFYCEALVEEMLTQHTRVACLREVQSSIKDSVKQLVEDKIKKLGVEPLFKITQVEIVGPNDSLMVFKGLKNQTAASIKSLEGFNRAFVEEAQTISQHSLDMLIPTIRAPGSQLWFGWNPFSPTDPIDRLFETNKDDPDFTCVPVTYADNPWFPDVLRRDMERDRARDPEKYHHVWLGGYQKNSEARVFKNWRVDTFKVPDGARPYYGGDWGFAIDPTVLVRIWIVGRTLYIDQEAYEVGCAIDKTPALFDTVEGARQWPITADSARPETIDYMRRHGYPHIQGARKGPGSLEDGIEFLKSFDIVVHPRCTHTIDELTSYSYKVDKLTGEVLPVLDDKKNHVLDAVRYSAEQVRVFDGGTVYETTESDIVIESFKLPKHWPRCWALDIDGSKASVLWASFDRDSDTAYIYAELIVLRHELALVADAIKTRNREFGSMDGAFNHLARGRDKMAGDRIVDALLDLKLGLYTVACTPEGAIPEVTRRLSTKRLKVFDTCPQWLSQYRAYRRNKDGDIVEESDGLMRAMDLLVMEGPGIAGFDDQSMQEARDEWDAGNRSSVTGY